TDSTAIGASPVLRLVSARGRSDPLIPGPRERHQQRTRCPSVQITSGKGPGSLQPTRATTKLTYRGRPLCLDQATNQSGRPGGASVRFGLTIVSFRQTCKRRPAARRWLPTSPSPPVPRRAFENRPAAAEDRGRCLSSCAPRPCSPCPPHRG